MSEKAKIRFWFFVASSLALALVISLVIGICFFTSLKKSKEPEAIARYRLSIGLADTGKSSMNVYRRNIVRNGVMCTDFSQISEKCGYTKIVNGNELRFYLNNNDDDVIVLENGKDVAYLNGVPIHLATPVYKIGDNVYLPIDVINNYFSGISVAVDDEKATIVIEYIDPPSCSLKIKYPSVCEALDKDLFPQQ